MIHKLYRKKHRVALPPGTYLKDEEQKPARIHLINYSGKKLVERDLTSVEESFEIRDPQSVTWINIDGRDVGVIEKIDEHFGVHPLVLEDIINVGQRPKVEDYGEHLFFVIKMVYFEDHRHEITAEQIGLVLGKNFVLSFQEKEGDVFEPIRARIRENKGRVRQHGADYLVYALLDAIVDHYFVVLERIGERIDQMEQLLFEDVVHSDVPMKIYHLKSSVIFLRKQIWPLREVLGSLQRLDSKLFKKTTEIYLRDVYDHTIQVNDTIEAFRDAVSGLHDIYLANVSNRMNEIMKVLTIFAAIFIPLTFIAGIYGMNFEFMPELNWRYGYFVVLGIMLVLACGMLYYFKKKNWI